MKYRLLFYLALLLLSVGAILLATIVIFNRPFGQKISKEPVMQTISFTDANNQSFPVEKVEVVSGGVTLKNKSDSGIVTSMETIELTKKIHFNSFLSILEGDAKEGVRFQISTDHTWMYVSPNGTWQNADCEDCWSDTNAINDNIKNLPIESSILHLRVLIERENGEAPILNAVEFGLSGSGISTPNALAESIIISSGDDGEWDKSSVEVSGKCDKTEGEAVFTIHNTGKKGEGDMDGPSEYRIYRNNILETTETFQLEGGEEIKIRVDAQGDEIRLEADQRPGHPGHSQPQDTVDKCGTPPPDEDMPPVAQNDEAETLINIPVIIAVLDNDSDSDGVLVESTLAIVTPPGSGSVDILGDYTIQYSPGLDFFRLDTFTYQICDNDALCDEATVSIYVSAPPTAEDDTAETAKNQNVIIAILDNDSDVDGVIDPTTVTILSGPDHGSVDVDPSSGAVLYDPDTDYTGSDSFTYEVCDDDVLCDSATVTIQISSTPPSAEDDTAETQKNQSVTIDILDNDTDVDGTIDPTSVTIISGPDHGSVDVDPDTGEVLYTPDTDYIGSDSFTYEVCDEDGLCDEAVVNIDVYAVPPVAENDTVHTTKNNSITIDILSNDTDSDGTIDPTSVTIVSGPTHGSVDVDPDTGEVLYNPELNYVGPDSFVYEVCDNDDLCDEATVVISVTSGGGGTLYFPPDAMDDNATTNENIPVVIEVLSNDTDSDNNLDTTSVLVVSPPANGTTSVSSEGLVTYTPNQNYSGNDVFTYIVCDFLSACDQANVTVEVVPITTHSSGGSIPPVARDDSASTNRDTSVEIDVLANDSDEDGELNKDTFTLISDPKLGSVQLLTDETGLFTGVILYVPNTNQTGSDEFDYRICDFDVLCDSATVRVEILGEVAPIAAPELVVLPPVSPAPAPVVAPLVVFPIILPSIASVVSAPIVAVSQPVFGAVEFVLNAQPVPLTPSGTVQFVRNEPETIFLEAKNASEAKIIDNTTKQDYKMTFDQDLKLWSADLIFDEVGLHDLQGYVANDAGTYERSINDAFVDERQIIADAISNLPLSDVTVTVFKKDVESQKFDVWNADAFSQQNPLLFSDGFSFVVPDGEYYVQLSKPGYFSVTSRIIKIDQESVITASTKLSQPKGIFDRIWSFLTARQKRSSFDLSMAGMVTQPSELIGQHMPNINLTDNGTSSSFYKLADHRPTIVFVFNSWSANAKEQIVVIRDAVTELNGNVQFILVSTMEPDAINSIHMRRGAYGLQQYKPDDSFYDAYQISTVPTFYFMDQKFDLQAVMNGAQSKDGLKYWIQEQLATQVPTL